MKRQSPGAERQEQYRWHHPQLNITLQSRHERDQIQRACRERGQTPREVLLAWAAAVLAEDPTSR